MASDPVNRQRMSGSEFYKGIPEFTVGLNSRCVYAIFSV